MTETAPPSKTPRPSKATRPSEARQREPAVLDVRSPDEWEAWLEANHEAVQEGVWLRLFKKGRTESTLDYVAAVEVALCFGWIDGQTKGHDDVSRVQRFTPRRARSVWSKINVERFERLAGEGRVRPAGVAAAEAAKADGRWAQAYDPPSRAAVPDDLLAALSGRPEAAAFFATLNKRNTYAIIHRLQTARTRETRAARLRAMIERLERGQRLYD